MYPELMVIPMREELTRAGIKETRTAEEVDAALAEAGTTLLVVNSICGCAAGKMRPGVRLALTNSANAPDHKITVFAGQDREATERARGYFEGNPPSSPGRRLHSKSPASWYGRSTSSAPGQRRKDSFQLPDKAFRHWATWRRLQFNRNLGSQHNGLLCGRPLCLWRWLRDFSRLPAPRAVSAPCCAGSNSRSK